MGARFDLLRSRRNSERKDYQKDILFSVGSMVYPGKLYNISMGGASVGSRNTNKIKRGDEIIIAIPFANQAGGIKRRAIVMWVDDGQFGIQFNRRANRRKFYPKEVTCSAGSMVFQGTIENISRGGACVGSPTLSIIQTPLFMRVTIPFARKPGTMQRKAVVRWSRNDQFGIQFL